MHTRRKLRVCLLCVFFSFLSSAIQAAARSVVTGVGNSGPFSTNQEGSYRYTSSGSGFSSQQSYSSQGMNGKESVSYAQWSSPGGQYHYATQWHSSENQGRATPSAATQPRLVLEFEQQTPYVGQPVLVTVRLIGDTNLSTLAVDIPNLSGLRIEKLAGPSARAVVIAGQRKVVTEEQYLYTPLRSGVLSLPTVAVSGSYVPISSYYNSRPEYASAARNSTEFSLQETATQTWQVQPAVLQENTWLPVEDLHLSATLDPDYARKLARGEPIRYTLRLAAKGVTGAFLPAMGARFTGQDFKWYADQSKTSGGLNERGVLQGERLESFTLIPQRNGNLQIPLLRIPWWNTVKKRAELAVLPARALAVAGVPRQNSGNAQASQLTQFSPFGYLLLVPLLALSLAGWWIFVGSKKLHHLIPSQPISPKTPATRLGVFFGKWRTAWISWSRKRCVSAVPGPVKAWHCIRCIQLEREPKAVSRLLQLYACKQMGLPRHASLSRIAEGLLNAHPNLAAEPVRALFDELDRAVYGGGTLDFSDWKRRFRKVLTPLFCSWRKNTRQASDALPDLNPIHL